MSYDIYRNVTVTLVIMTQKSIQKARTRQALLDALTVELIRPERLTAERIAQSASVNKALLYRYFGGIAGLLVAFAESDNFMPMAAELGALLPADIDRLPARARFALCIEAYIRALAERPATVQILLRFHDMDPEVVSALRSGRSRAIEEIRKLFGQTDDSLEVDLDLSFALMILGVCQVLGQAQELWLGKESDREDLAKRLSKTVHGLLHVPQAHAIG